MRKPVFSRSESQVTRRVGLLPRPVGLHVCEGIREARSKSTAKQKEKPTPRVSKRPTAVPVHT